MLAVAIQRHARRDGHTGADRHPREGKIAEEA
jgi:hypothetical protein